MADLHRETTEALQREQRIQLLRKFSPLIIGLIALIVLSVAGVQYYQHARKQSNLEEAHLFLSLRQTLDGKDDLSEEINDSLEKMLQGRTGYALAAHLKLARYHIQRGELDQAIAVYHQLHENDAWHALYKTFSGLQIAVLTYMQDKDYSALQNKLGTLIDSSDAKWHPQIMLWGAQAAFDANDLVSARSWLERLTTHSNAAETIKRQANIMIDNIDAR